MVVYSLVVTLENAQLLLSNLNDIIIPPYRLTKNLLKKEGFGLKGGSALIWQIFFNLKNWEVLEILEISVFLV